MRLFRRHQQLRFDDRQLLRRHQLLRHHRHHRGMNRKNLLILHYFLVGVILGEYFLILLRILVRVQHLCHLRQIRQRDQQQQVRRHHLRHRLK